VTGSVYAASAAASRARASAGSNRRPRGQDGARRHGGRQSAVELRLHVAHAALVVGRVEPEAPGAASRPQHSVVLLD
jgi:hypothetical protein